MSCEQYIAKSFSKRNSQLIDYMNDLIEDYQRQGYVLTVRQLYYQLVARDVIENTLQSYKRTANLINDAKLAGHMDWDAIEDRTREFLTNPHWDAGSSILRSAAQSYGQDMWANQETRVFVVIEKEALIGVLTGTCRKWDVPILAARGYPSGSVLRGFAEDHLLPALYAGQRVRVLHLGDHDPSGIDMTRDLIERLSLFTRHEMDDSDLDRIALTMDQIDEIKPPENPAKTTDSRFAAYRPQYGTSSWELDALSPQYLNNLLEGHIEDHVDPDAWAEKSAEVDAVRNDLHHLARSQEEKEARS
ncbi:hypothetical protein JLK41_08950 [Ectopseudomonas khazarica]|uniref:hypothetical protein n=1 Tax=Ectopseudomonas khazarica TaxID=2502979 RepID=UPI001AEFD99B|nr:hypothetical protein [Pseudomonas khazarica]QTS88270.1 hypothetical protein JLK41_08950 [Pseudomonas khazarica]